MPDAPSRPAADGLEAQVASTVRLMEARRPAPGRSDAVTAAIGPVHRVPDHG